MMENQSAPVLPDNDDFDFDGSVAATLPTIALGVGVVLAVWTAIHLGSATSPRQYMLGLGCGVSAIVLFVYSSLLRRWRAQGGTRGNAWACVVLFVAQFNCFLPPATIPRTIHHIDAVFCLVGASCIFLSRRWVAFAVASTFGWWLLFTVGLRDDPAWYRANLNLVAAGTLAFVIHEARRSVFVRLARLHREADAQRRAAEAAHATKSMFLANMSHELRTPLTSILGFAELLREDEDVPRSPGVDEALRAIEGNAQHLRDLVDDILDLSKLESGAVVLERRSCDPVEIGRDALSVVSLQAAGRGLALEFEATASHVRLRTDPTRLRQILVNLLGNAVKFTHHGSVTLRLRLQDRGAADTLDFEVVDTGIGITDEQRALIFDPFRQADSTTTRKYGGTGLGLAISQRLARELGGTLSCTSRPGVGSTFTLSLPVVKDDSTAAPLSRSSTPAPTVERDRPSPLVPERETIKPLAGRRLLLVEDCADSRRLVRLLLERAGATVEVAEQGREAVDAVTAHPNRFDLVLMDMQMPVLDGYQATRTLREREYRSPIVALTAHSSPHDRALCLDAGCDDHATKPIERTTLVNLVERWTTDEGHALRDAAIA